MVAVGEDAGERATLMVADLFPDRIGEKLVVAGGYLKKLLRVGDGEGLENDGIDEAEDGGVGSDSECERKDGDGSECGGGSEGAGGVAKVLREAVEHLGIMTPCVYDIRR